MLKKIDCNLLFMEVYVIHLNIRVFLDPNTKILKINLSQMEERTKHTKNAPTVLLEASTQYLRPDYGVFYLYITI